jgi:hypothetical protein
VADHPVKLPPEVFAELLSEAMEKTSKPGTVAAMVADRAAQWGADQELEACIDVLTSQSAWDDLSQCVGWKEFRDQSENILRSARRPKPPTLAEQALEAHERSRFGSPGDRDIIGAALNRLAELEVRQ